MPRREVRVRIVVTGTGATKVVEQFATGKSSTISAKLAVRRVVDGVPVRFVVSVGDNISTLNAATTVVIAYNAKATKLSVAGVQKVVDAVPVGTTLFFVGHTFGQGHGNVAKNATRIGETAPPAYHFIVSGVKDVDAPFEAAARTANLAVLCTGADALRKAVRLAPREDGVGHALARLSLQEYAHQYTKRQIPVFVALDIADLDDMADRRNEIPPGVFREVLVWLPAADQLSVRSSDTSRRGKLLRDVIQRERVFFHNGINYETMQDGLSANLRYGRLPNQENDISRADALARLEPLTYQNAPARTLVPWPRGASLYPLFNGGATEWAIAHVQARHVLWSTPSARAFPAWAAATHACAAIREQIKLADFGVVEYSEGIPPGRVGYEFDKAVKLGQGAFGCVLKVPRVGGGAVALKVQGMKTSRDSIAPVAADFVRAKHEIALMKHVHRAAVELGAMTPFVIPLFDSYITEPLPTITKKVSVNSALADFRIGGRTFIAGGSTREDSPVAQAIALGQVAARVCTSMNINNLKSGLVVTEMPIASVADINGENANILTSESQRRAWAFHLFHGLAAMSSAVDFAHQDVKPANVFVFRNDDLDLGDVRRTRVRWHTPGTDHVVDVVVRDTAPTVAMLGDFGLSIAKRATLLGFDGPVFRSYNGDQQHTTGTVNYTDPIMGVYFSANLSSNDAVTARYAGSFRERGVAGDVWALGLVLLNVWMQDDAIGAKPVGYTGSWGRRKVISLVGITASMRKFVADMVLATPAKNPQYVSEEAAREHPGGYSYFNMFVHAAVLYFAFHNTWPKAPNATVPPGPYWGYMTKHWDALRKASANGPLMAYQHIAGNLKAHQPNVYAFIKRCLAWDPEERVRFLLEGGAFAHAMFHDDEAKKMLEFADPEVAEAAYMLDLTVPIVRGVESVLDVEDLSNVPVVPNVPPEVPEVPEIIQAIASQWQKAVVVADARGVWRVDIAEKDLGNTLLTHILAILAFRYSGDITDTDVKNVTTVIDTWRATHSIADGVELDADLLTAPNTPRDEISIPRSTPLNLAVKTNDERVLDVVLDNLRTPTGTYIPGAMLAQSKYGGNVLHVAIMFGAVQPALTIITRLADSGQHDLVQAMMGQKNSIGDTPFGWFEKYSVTTSIVRHPEFFPGRKMAAAAFVPNTIDEGHKSRIGTKAEVTLQDWRAMFWGKAFQNVMTRVGMPIPVLHKQHRVKTTLHHAYDARHVADVVDSIDVGAGRTYMIIIDMANTLARKASGAPTDGAVQVKYADEDWQFHDDVFQQIFDLAKGDDVSATIINSAHRGNVDDVRKHFPTAQTKSMLISTYAAFQREIGDTVFKIINGSLVSFSAGNKSPYTDVVFISNSVDDRATVQASIVGVVENLHLFNAVFARDPIEEVPTTVVGAHKDVKSIGDIVDAIQSKVRRRVRETHLVVFDLDDTLIGGQPFEVMARLYRDQIESGTMEYPTDMPQNERDRLARAGYIFMRIDGKEKLVSTCIFAKIRDLAKSVVVKVLTIREDLGTTPDDLKDALDGVAIESAGTAGERGDRKGITIKKWAAEFTSVYFVDDVDTHRESVRRELDGVVHTVDTYNTEFTNGVINDLADATEGHDLPGICQTIKNTAVFNVEDMFTYNAIEDIATVANENSLVIFDYDDTLATTPGKVFPNDSVADATQKMQPAVDFGNLKKLHDDTYGPANIEKLANLPGRIAIITTRNKVGVAAARTVLDTVGLRNVNIISAAKTTGKTKAGEISRMLSLTAADVVYFVDNSRRQRADVQKNVTVGANALHIYNVSLSGYIQRMYPIHTLFMVRIQEGIANSPMEAIDVLAQQSAEADVCIIEVDHVLAEHEEAFVHRTNLDAYIRKHGEDAASTNLLWPSAAGVLGVEVVGEMRVAGRRVAPRLYGPANINLLENLPGKVVCVMGPIDSQGVLETDVLNMLTGKGVTRAVIERQRCDETKAQTVQRILEKVPADTAHLVFSEGVKQDFGVVPRGANRVIVYEADLGEYVANFV